MTIARANRFDGQVFCLMALPYQELSGQSNLCIAFGAHYGFA
jgi:hypothetical protein